MSQSRRPGKRAYLMITGFALLLVLFPFLFWYSTWFGRPLNDSDLDKYFADSAHPRHAQHALVQIGERMSHHRDVSRWYPQIVRAAGSPNAELRQTAAWIMGQDHGYAPFHDALLQLIHDPETMVRRNAALGLAAFGDSAARPELVAMLRPFTVQSSAAGTVRYRLCESGNARGARRGGRGPLGRAGRGPKPRPERGRSRAGRGRAGGTRPGQGTRLGGLASPVFSGRTGGSRRRGAVYAHVPDHLRNPGEAGDDGGGGYPHTRRPIVSNSTMGLRLPPVCA
jgi:hypothetical protein